MNNQITDISTYVVNAGWRKWLFLEIELGNKITGISEFTDSNGSIDSLLAGIGDIKRDLLGQEFNSVLEFTDALRRKYRQALPGIMWKAISAVENALWDLRSKIDNKPIHEYFNSTTPNKIKFEAYWSHCPTTRVRASEHILANPIRTNQDLVELGSLILEKKFRAIKTNLVSLSPKNQVFMPGFNKNFSLAKQKIPDGYSFELANILNLISSLNPNLEYIVDFNYNLTFVEFIEFQEVLKQSNIKYFELDFDDYDTKEVFLNNALIPICTGENILGLWNYMPILSDPRIQIVSIDLLWNGLSESVKIAHRAIDYGKKVAIHNYYGGLATSMALIFLSLLPPEHLELVEFDFDDVSWRDHIISSPAKFEDGFLSLDLGLGWSSELNLQAAHDFIQ